MKIPTVSSHLCVRLGIICIACLVLSACFFLPGQFHSELDIRRDGRFTYRYQGEVVFLFPQESIEKEWDDAEARCHAEAGGTFEPRPCTDDEIASQRKAFETERESAREMGQEFAELIGFNPLDPGANERLAQELKQYPGWKDVRYTGRGIFYVDYEQSGVLDRDFAFPVIPQVQMAMPFIHITPGKSGSANITAGGLASRQFRKIVLSQMERSDRDDPLTHATQALLKLSKGTFTVTTDAEISATNGKQSGDKGHRQIEWTFEGGNSETPNLQLALDP